VLLRILFLIIAACGGAFLNYAGAWVVHHDGINYRLPVPVSTAAETAFALGPVLCVVGVILAIPTALGFGRHVQQFCKLIALQAFVYLTLMCGLGSVSGVGLLGFLGATVVLWAVALIWAAVSPALLSKLGAPPNDGPSALVASSQNTKGPQSVT